MCHAKVRSKLLVVVPSNFCIVTRAFVHANHLAQMVPEFVMVVVFDTR